jgi:hypothetical protein
MLNKKTLINNKNTKKSENKGLTPAVDMIGYTDIMINNTNKKDTMTTMTNIIKETVATAKFNKMPKKEAMRLFSKIFNLSKDDEGNLILKKFKLLINLSSLQYKSLTPEDIKEASKLKGFEPEKVNYIKMA